MDNFRNLNEFKKFLRKEKKAPDIIMLNNKIFTMDCYDEIGKILTYGNKKLRLGLIVETKDRYKTKYNSGLKVYYEKEHDYYFNINYKE
jgi:hypothetical protein